MLNGVYIFMVVRVIWRFMCSSELWGFASQEVKVFENKVLCLKLWEDWEEF